MTAAGSSECAVASPEQQLEEWWQLGTRAEQVEGAELVGVPGKREHKPEAALRWTAPSSVAALYNKLVEVQPSVLELSACEKQTVR
jgi:hypothetical protein